MTIKTANKSYTNSDSHFTHTTPSFALALRKRICIILLKHKNLKLKKKKNHASKIGLRLIIIIKKNAKKTQSSYTIRFFESFEEAKKKVKSTRLCV